MKLFKANCMISEALKSLVLYAKGCKYCNLRLIELVNENLNPQMYSSPTLKSFELNFHGGKILFFIQGNRIRPLADKKFLMVEGRQWRVLYSLSDHCGDSFLLIIFGVQNCGYGLLSADIDAICIYLHIKLISYQFYLWRFKVGSGVSNSGLKRVATNLKAMFRPLKALFFHLCLNIPVEIKLLKMCIILLSTIQLLC